MEFFKYSDPGVSFSGSVKSPQKDSLLGQGFTHGKY